MAYKIDVKAVAEYIDYLKKFKKNLVNNLSDFNRDIKRAHSFWDDNNYVLTIEAKDKVSKEQQRLIESIDKSIKKLSIMRDEYEKYLRRR